MRSSKVELRERYRELRELVNRWDPIGVMDDPEWPRDEYECLVGPVLRRLEEGAPVSALAAFPRGELTDHFGLSTPDQEVETGHVRPGSGMGHVGRRRKARRARTSFKRREASA